MTPQEQQLLDDFLIRLRNASGVTRDAQADALIRTRLAAQSDAQYLLVQRALLLEQALEQAKALIAQLQQAGVGAGGGSFLGQGLGSGSPPPLPSPPPAAVPGWRERLFGSAPGGRSAEPVAAGVAAAPAARGPGFLGSAATTAAGVAGGLFLFEGIEHLFGGAAGGGLLGGGAAREVVVDNVTNNYYQEPPTSATGDADFADDSGFADDFGGGDDSWT